MMVSRRYPWKMEFIEQAYLLFSAGMVVAGLTMVGLAVKAYRDTTRQSMVHLSLGFALVVAAAVTTAVSAFTTGFSNVRSLLLVDSGLSMAGYTFVVYSLVVYE